MNAIERDAYARWKRSFCGPRCPCDTCAYKRALAKADEPLTLVEVDLDDPVFSGLLEQSEAVRSEQEAVLKNRVATYIALERWGR